MTECHSSSGVLDSLARKYADDNGNLTSQLLANVYLNELDSYVKQKLKIKYYVRYADDFVLLSRDKIELRRLLGVIGDWLEKELKLQLHPNKVSITTVASGVDFLGWVHFSKYRVLRGVTRKRMMRKVQAGVSDESLASYMGMLGWGNGYKLVCSVNTLKELKRAEEVFEKKSL